MKTTQINSVALFMALAMTAAPAFAGMSRGGTTRASTDEYSSLETGSSPTAESSKTTEVPLAGHVNIQPSVRTGDGVKAGSDANARLKATGVAKDTENTAGSGMSSSGRVNRSPDMKSDNSIAAKTANDPDAPPSVR